MIDATRPGRLPLVITMMLSTFALLIGAFYGMWTSVHTSQWTVAAFLLLLVVFWILAVDSIFRQIPRIVLSEDRISAQFLFRKHFFTWQEILQAGILYRVGRGFPSTILFCCFPVVLPVEIPTNSFFCGTGESFCTCVHRWKFVIS